MADNIKKEDHTTHHLLSLREPPSSLVALRQELAFHSDITDYAQHGADFGEVLGRIALKLDIALDGDYNAEDLCGVLVEALRHRRFFPDSPHLRAKGLVDVELIETETEVTLVKRDRNVQTVLPTDAIITENSTGVEEETGAETEDEC